MASIETWNIMTQWVQSPVSIDRSNGEAAGADRERERKRERERERVCVCVL